MLHASFGATEAAWLSDRAEQRHRAHETWAAFGPNPVGIANLSLVGEVEYNPGDLWYSALTRDNPCLSPLVFLVTQLFPVISFFLSLCHFFLSLHFFL